MYLLMLTNGTLLKVLSFFHILFISVFETMFFWLQNSSLTNPIIPVFWDVCGKVQYSKLNTWLVKTQEIHTGLPERGLPE